jgi:hypothetical protein
MKQITPCAWIDERDQSLHIDVPKMLRELGVPDTPETREAATKMAAEQLQKMCKHAVIKTT